VFRLPLDFASPAVGVGNNPDSIAPVSGIDGASWYNKRLRGVTKAFQVSQHVVEPHADVPKHILTNEPSGSDNRQKVASCRPEPAVICLALALPGKGSRLTGVAGGDDSDSTRPGSISASNVPEVRDVWESLCENAASVRLDLTESECAKSSTSGCKCEASDSAEEIEMGEMLHVIRIAPSAPPNVQAAHRAARCSRRA